MAGCEGDFKLLVKGALYSGARFGELRRLRVGHLHGAWLHLPAAITKTGKERRIALGPEAEQFFSDVCSGRDPNEPIFTRNGKEWGDHDQHRPMREACKAAGISPPVNLYALRHTAASNWLRQGVPSMKFISEQLGNSVAICDRVYAHLALDDRAKVFAGLEPLALDQPAKSAPQSPRKARARSVSIQ